MLRLLKEGIIKIKFFKSLHKSLLLFVLFVTFLNFGFSFKEIKPITFEEKLKSKIKVKVNYTDGPSQSDFFTRSETGDYLNLGSLKKIEGVWLGKYDLSKESVFWINPNLKSSRIYNVVAFGPYDIYLKFNLINDSKLIGLKISQEGVNYGPVNVGIPNNKQINYWTRAVSSNWAEVIRGKIFRISEGELFTEFQTTVYEEKGPIYAFQGKAVLKKVEEW